MKKTNLFVVILSLIAISFVIFDYFYLHDKKLPTDLNNIVKNNETKILKPSDEKDVYTCPMHPSVISDKAGSCPICGMTLVKKHNHSKEEKTESSTDLSEISLSPSQQVMSNIATELVKRKTLETEINSIGRVTLDETKNAQISAWIGGRINKLYVNFTGAKVNKGQKMFDIYSPDLASAQQEYIQAYESYLSLNKSELKEIADSATSMLNASKKRLLLLGIKKEQLKQLEKTRKADFSISIYSPASGVITKKNVQEGQYVNMGDLVFELSDLSNLWVESNIYESDLINVKNGQMVEISTETYPNEVFMGHIEFIKPMLDPNTKTATIRISLANKNNKLKPEMTVNTKIKSFLGNSLVVPKSAVILSGKKAIVWVEKKPKIYIPKEVKLGKSNDEFFPVISGLSENEKIVTSGGFLLDSESQINTPVNKDNSEQKTLEKTPKPDMDMSNMKM